MQHLEWERRHVNILKNTLCTSVEHILPIRRTHFPANLALFLPFIRFLISVTFSLYNVVSLNDRITSHYQIYEEWKQSRILDTKGAAWKRCKKHRSNSDNGSLRLNSVMQIVDTLIIAAVLSSDEPVFWINFAHRFKTAHMNVLHAISSRMTRFNWRELLCGILIIAAANFVCHRTVACLTKFGEKKTKLKNRAILLCCVCICPTPFLSFCYMSHA